LAERFRLRHLRNGLALENEEIFEFVHHPERLHRANQGLQ